MVMTDDGVIQEDVWMCEEWKSGDMERAYEYHKP